MPTPLPVLPNVYYAHLSMTYDALPSGNVFAWLCSAASATEAQDFDRATAIATSMATQWVATMLPLYPDRVHGDSVKVYALGHATLPAAVVPMTGAGADSTPLAANSAAAVIKHVVTRRGRGSQSHSAISPLPGHVIESGGGTLTDAHVLALSEEFGDFLGFVESDFAAAFSGLTISYVQLSRKGSGATYPITSSACEKVLGTERSRTRRP